MFKMNPYIKIGAGLAIGARLGQWLMAAVETAADRWLTKKSDEAQAECDACKDTESKEATE